MNSVKENNRIRTIVLDSNNNVLQLLKERELKETVIDCSVGIKLSPTNKLQFIVSIKLSAEYSQIETYY